MKRTPRTDRLNRLLDVAAAGANLIRVWTADEGRIEDEQKDVRARSRLVRALGKLKMRELAYLARRKCAAPSGRPKKPRK